MRLCFQIESSVKWCGGFVNSLNFKAMVDCHVSDNTSCFNNYSEADGS